MPVNNNIRKLKIINLGTQSSTYAMQSPSSLATYPSLLRNSSESVHFDALAAAQKINMQRHATDAFGLAGANMSATVMAVLRERTHSGACILGVALRLAVTTIHSPAPGPERCRVRPRCSCAEYRHFVVGPTCSALVRADACRCFCMARLGIRSDEGCKLGEATCASTVARERSRGADIMELSAMALERLQVGAAACIPDLDCTVVRRRRQPRQVARENH
jgi:hypothetical protein